MASHLAGFQSAFQYVGCKPIFILLESSRWFPECFEVGYFHDLCVMPLKEIVKVVISAGQIVGRAFTRALQREIEQSQQAARARAAAGASSSESHRATASDVLTGMTLQEAKMILNINDINNKEEFMKNYEHLFNANEKAKGGCLYLQSKIVRAKERIEQELPETTANKESTDTSDSTTGKT